MKTIKNIFVAMIAVLAVSCSQDDVENRPVVTPLDAPVLTAPEEGNSYTLSPENMELLAERFVWSAANFGEGVIPSYDVQIDFAGNNFASPQIIGSTNGSMQLAATTNVLNTALLNLGATPFESANFEVRVRAYVGQQEIVSNVVEMIISPYTTEAPKMYVVGNFLAASGYGSDWDPASGVMIAAPAYGTTNFEGFVYMANATPEFKFLPTNTSFDGDYGDDGSFAGTLVQTGESNITVAAPGYYYVKADTNALTYSVQPTSWAVTGSATPAGWPDAGAGINDYDMTYDPASKKWTISLALTGGQKIKFRANDDWALNFGGTTDGLSFNGPDIDVATSGNYLITLDLSNPRAYTYSLTAN
ncbi:SusE domain-containing protein [Flavobacterium sp.]|uniref:SusE domain-containing protein n=1 Tax=Flavobacterium sp. TaxID=239 RepID=UPI001220001D|nr:SusE domain-containing protein [Flavobacterium sp.]RZJ71594.1 MAG: hypothetical protein EOO49_09555 [Flavobacterium sp.]